MSDKALRHLLGKANGWQIMLPGVYLAVPGNPATDSRHMAALLYAGPGSVLTGNAAIWRHRVACDSLGPIDVLISHELHRKSTGFVRILRTTRMPERCRTEDGIRFAYLPRAVGDAVRSMRDSREVQSLVYRIIQSTSCQVAHLARELDAGPVAGTRLFRAALAEASEGIRSVAEGDLKKLIDRSDVEKPLYNPQLYLPDGTFLCSPDLWWERYGVAGEVDSLAHHFSAKDHENTMKRHNRVEGAGIRLLHWLPTTITREPKTVLTDIRNALADGATRIPPRFITVPAGQAPPPGCRPPNGGPPKGCR